MIESTKGDDSMIQFIQCMLIDPYFCCLALGQMISWVGITVCAVFAIKQFIQE